MSVPSDLRAKAPMDDSVSTGFSIPSKKPLLFAKKVTVNNSLIVHFVDNVIFLLSAGDDFFLQALRQVINLINDEKLIRQIKVFCEQEIYKSNLLDKPNRLDKHSDEENTDLVKIELLEQFERLLKQGRKYQLIAKLDFYAQSEAEAETDIDGHDISDFDIVSSDSIHLLLDKGKVCSILLARCRQAWVPISDF